VLKNPIFDTEYAGPGRELTSLFLRPMGQANAVGRAKTWGDTNLTQSSLLGSPCEFDWFQWRMEFDPSVPLQNVLAFRFFSRLSFRFCDRAWFSTPLSYVPFTSYRSAEEIKQVVSVLVCENTKILFSEAWDKATIFKPGERLPEVGEFGEVVKDRVNIYRTEDARRIDYANRPIRIKSLENFAAEVHTDWGASAMLPKEDFAVRLYLEGLLYAPV
jgi:hypothetical protein